MCAFFCTAPLLAIEQTFVNLFVDFLVYISQNGISVSFLIQSAVFRTYFGENWILRIQSDVSIFTPIFQTRSSNEIWKIVLSCTFDPVIFYTSSRIVTSEVNVPVKKVFSALPHSPYVLRAGDRRKLSWVHYLILLQRLDSLYWAQVDGLRRDCRRGRGLPHDALRLREDAHHARGERGGVETKERSE